MQMPDTFPLLTDPPLGELSLMTAQTGHGKTFYAAQMAAKALKDGAIFYVNNKRVSTPQDVVDLLNGDL